MLLSQVAFSWASFVTAIILLVFYTLLKFIYRITFHPLAKFPGPVLAALTYKYEFYYDFVEDGKYTEEILRMHDVYGPIVRINPDELHCNDPEFIDQIYAGPGKRREKWSYFVQGQGTMLRKSGFATIDHDLHRLRRGALNRFFSKAAITKMEPTISMLAQKLCDKLLVKSSEKKPIELTTAYSCMTVDVISSYCFGHDDGYLDQEDFTANIRPGLLVGANMQILGRQWPLLFNVMDMMPTSIISVIAPQLNTWFGFMKVLADQVVKMKQDYDEGRYEGLKGRTTVFRELLESNLPPEEKSIERLSSEAITIIGAGTETTAWTLSVLSYHILSRKDVMSRLEKELRTVVQDPKELPPCAVLEQLPYLISLRHAYGVASRLSRIAPDEALVYKGFRKSAMNEFARPIEIVIPPGTAIGMSSYIMHANPYIFPEPEKFIPERWLNKDGTRRRDLEGYLLSFSKGSRQCLGINLAHCELYVVLTALILRVFPAIELFETTLKDVKYHHEKFVMLPDPSSLGVRVMGKDQ